jgi:hypothetical protein
VPKTRQEKYGDIQNMFENPKPRPQPELSSEDNKQKAKFTLLESDTHMNAIIVDWSSKIVKYVGAKGVAKLGPIHIRNVMVVAEDFYGQQASANVLKIKSTF